MTGAHWLEGLVKWTRREEWRDVFSDIFSRHVGPPCSAAGVDLTDLPQLIGDHWYMSLWGCAFEDLVSRTLDDGRNIADDYLKRRGWKETAPTRAYIAALRSSVVSLYEASDIVVGGSFLARDLVRGGEPVRVHEKSGTKSLAQWDRISARVLTVNGKIEISGGVLQFDHGSSEEALASIDRVMKNARKRAGKLAKSLGRPADDPSIEAAFAIDTVLASASFMFSNMWLRDVLAKALNPVPRQITNSDGEPLEFLSVHYPLTPLAEPASIYSALASNPEFRAESDGFWNWVKQPKHGRAKKSAAAQSLITMTDDGGIMLGSIELKGKTLTLSVNSAARAARGRALIEPLLAGMVREPLVERQTIEQMMASADRKGGNEPPLGLAPEQERAIVHQGLTDHYGRMLDEPIPALGNTTPRKAAKTAKGRGRVIAWLKMLENHSAQQPAGDPMADYDFTWLWEELGLGDQRR
jgi:hypothetical protein